MAFLVAVIAGLLTGMGAAKLHPIVDAGPLVSAGAGIVGGWLGSAILGGTFTPALGGSAMAATAAGAAVGGIVASLAAGVAIRRLQLRDRR